MDIKTRFDNDDHYDGVNKIQYIVIHDTGNVTDSDEGNANYFCTGTRNASAHYFVDNDSITQIVRDVDGAFHCGDGKNAYGINNRNSLGIEMCRVNGVVTEITETNTLELVKLKMKEYGVPAERVVRHYDASRKNCPESFNLDGKWTRWSRFKAKLSKPAYQERYVRLFQIFYNEATKTSPQLKVDGEYGNLSQEAYKTLGRLLGGVY